MARYSRKQYIVKKDLQLRILFEMVIFLLIVAVLVSISVYVGFYKTLIFDLGGEKITLVNRFFTFRMFLYFLPTIFAIIVIGILFSHRISGPMFVFQRVIRNLLAGKPVNKIYLRKRDKLKDFAEDLNRLIDYFEREQSQSLKERRDKSEVSDT